MPKAVIKDQLYGDSTISITWGEYYVSILPKETEVYFRQKRLAPFGTGPDEGVGIFKFAWNYDGICAEVECKGQRIGIWMNEKGSKIKRYKGPFLWAGEGI